MFCDSSNCRVMLVEPSEFTEVIWVMPGISENCRSSGVATFEAMVSGLAPGSVALTWRVGKIHVRQRRHRQAEIADDADQQERDRDQRGGDRPVDEGAGEIHGPPAWAPADDPDQRAGFQDHLAVGDDRLRPASDPG